MKKKKNTTLRTQYGGKRIKKKKNTPSVGRDTKMRNQPMYDEENGNSNITVIVF